MFLVTFGFRNYPIKSLEVRSSTERSYVVFQLQKVSFDWLIFWRVWTNLPNKLIQTKSAILLSRTGKHEIEVLRTRACKIEIFSQAKLKLWTFDWKAYFLSNAWVDVSKGSICLWVFDFFTMNTFSEKLLFRIPKTSIL